MAISKHLKVNIVLYHYLLSILKSSYAEQFVLHHYIFLVVAQVNILYVLYSLLRISLKQCVITVKYTI